MLKTAFYYSMFSIKKKLLIDARLSGSSLN